MWKIFNRDLLENHQGYKSYIGLIKTCMKSKITIVKFCNSHYGNELLPLNPSAGKKKTIHECSTHAQKSRCAPPIKNCSDLKKQTSRYAATLPNHRLPYHRQPSSSTPCDRRNPTCSIFSRINSENHWTLLFQSNESSGSKQLSPGLGIAKSTSSDLETRKMTSDDLEKWLDF